MFEQIILGIVQGVTEWLPVSSEGATILIQVNFFGGSDNVTDLVRQALFLHLGTFFAALVYFWKDVVGVVRTLFNYRAAESSQQNLLKFLVIATLLSGGIGIVLLNWLAISDLGATAKTINIVVGVLLLVTAFLQIKAGSGGLRSLSDVNSSDSVLLGVVQGLATLPGLSRSGLTVSTLLIRKVQDDLSLKLSFLLSLPIVLGGNILLNLKGFALSGEMLVGLLFSFVFGLLTIHLLLKLAKRINFGYFVLVFAILVLVSVFV